MSKKVIGSISFKANFKNEEDKQDIMDCLNEVINEVSGHCFVLDGTLELVSCEINVEGEK